MHVAMDAGDTGVDFVPAHGAAQANRRRNILPGAMLGSAESPRHRRHRPDARKNAGLNFLLSFDEIKWCVHLLIVRATLTHTSLIA